MTRGALLGIDDFAAFHELRIIRVGLGRLIVGKNRSRSNNEQERGEQPNGSARPVPLIWIGQFVCI